MRSKFLVLASIVTILAMAFMAVTPAAAAGEKSITFLGAYLVDGKGVVFEFKVIGEFSDLSGFVKVGGQQFSLSCHFNSKGNLACTANHGLSQFVGQIAQGSIAGHDFSGLIRGVTTNCYSVFDIKFGDPGWENIGSYCQNSPAQPGDQIYYYNPNRLFETLYQYSNTDGSDVCLGAQNLGNGYYHICFN